MEEYVNLKTALLAKEKGFDWWCRYYYETNDKPATVQNLNFRNKEGFKQPAIPTQASLQKWLREVHNVNDANRLLYAGTDY